MNIQFSINDVISKLENDSVTLIKWYESNYLQPNPDKFFYFLCIFVRGRKQRGLDRRLYDTHNIEHRTEPVSH